MSFNLADLFEGLADSFGSRLALVVGDKEFSYAQLDERATRLANAWRDAGLGEGDHIGLYLFNSHEYLECMLAAWKLRCRTINVNYRYVAEELRYLFDNARLKGLIYEPELREHVQQASTPSLRYHLERGPDYEAALSAASPVRDFPPRSQEDLVIIYTGGTTGMPRGVMWRHEDLFFAALQGGNPGGEPFSDPQQMIAQLTENGDGLHVFTAPPLIHGSSQLASWISMLNGGVAVLCPGRSYNPEFMLDLCDKHSVQSLNLVGDAMTLPLIDCLERFPGRWQLNALNVVTSAGALLSYSLIEKLEALLPNIVVLNNYGSSESGHQGSAFYEAGKPIWYMSDSHTLVVDENREPVKPGSSVIGKLARFGHVPIGYFEDPKKTAETFFTRDGVRYVMPGDMAMVADDGSIIFLGRDSACINSGGEKVFAEEVEEALKHDPRVHDAVVVGVPDERLGQRVEALVMLREPTATQSDLESACRQRIAGYKVPKKIWVVETLNRQPSGKPDYRWARSHAEQLGACP